MAEDRRSAMGTLTTSGLSGTDRARAGLGEPSPTSWSPTSWGSRESGLTRRDALRMGSAAGLLGVTGLWPGRAAAAQDPIVKYMTKVATRLQKAARQASPPAFLKVIRKHADTPSIATYSLGRYRSGLRRSRRSAYYNGVARLIAYYFAEQTKQYRVKKFEMGSKTWQEGKFHSLTARSR